MILNKIIRKVRSVLESDQKKFEKYLESQHFYPISHTLPEDVFIAGYPKSGNTWMQHLLASLLFGVEPQYLPDRLAQELVPDMHVKKYYKRFLPFSCFKTHAFPRPEYRKVIHLVRDGRDAMASYYAMNKALGKSSSLEEMIVDGKNLFPGKWHVHTRQWLDNPYDAEIIEVKYEDLLNEPQQELEKICAFLGLERSEDLIARCISGNSFKSMQKREKSYGMDNKKWNKDEKFVRKGKSGSYKTEVPDHLVQHFTDESSEELKHFGYL